ncbi:MAG: type II secretion system F family protein [Peptococcaceae bacterium]|jgi:tight adherence protein B|nr:type II secretion system F family protein [Peptococcaceae bacterium]MDH7524794.1 type II secretion system F family protein [Peptococcaceae bacterium]
MEIRFIVMSACGFVSVTSGIFGLYLLATRERRRLQERLEKMTDLSWRKRQEEPAGKEQGTGLGAVLGRAGRFLFRKGMTKKIEEQLAAAGLPLRGEEFLAAWAFCALVPVSAARLVTSNLVFVLLVYLAGVLAPLLFIGSARRKRQKKFNQQMSDSLSIMSNALRAGFSFVQSMEVVSREMPEPVAGEFARTCREISLGTSVEEALQKMVKRVASADLDLLVTAVLIQRQVGGNLAEILDNISCTIRERIRIQGEIRTLTAQGRISGIIIGLLPPALIILLLLINPGYLLPLFKTRAGHLMLAGGVFAEAAGVLLIKKIVSIDY